MQKGWCVWVTGLPGSGKSSIANALLNTLRKKSVHAQILSSDKLRRIITPDPKYTHEEREIVYGAIVFVAQLLTDNGVNVVIDATANRRKYRNDARKEISRFLEAYVRCPLKVCMERESQRKGDTHQAPEAIYEKALTGESNTVPGIGVPYEEPLNPEVTVDSEKMDPNECAEEILKAMEERFFPRSRHDCQTSRSGGTNLLSL